MLAIEETLNQLFASEPLTKTDSIISRHSVRVSGLCLVIGHNMGLTHSDLVDIKTIGLLHDIGKTTLPRSILAKPARLTKKEFALVQNHPQAGAKLLKEAGYEKRIIQGVRNHHERLDGSGYPTGLGESCLNVLSRIIAVADVYEAMTSDRPYRKALPDCEAIAELRQPRKFDQAIVDALIRGLSSSKTAISISSLDELDSLGDFLEADCERELG